MHDNSVPLTNFSINAINIHDPNITKNISKIEDLNRDANTITLGF